MRAAASLAAAGLALATVMVIAGAALGADPTSVPTEVLGGGDLRSEGEGPGLVGSPLLILAGVVLLGIATASVTAIVVRLTQHD